VKISEVLSKLHSKIMKGCVMAQAVSRWPLTAEAWVSPRGICGGKSGTGTGFSLEFFGFPLKLSFHHGSSHSI
jgi:hypothetical protein